MAAWPRRRSLQRSSGEHWHGADAYRTRMAGTGRSNGVLGRWWSYGGGAGVARRELCAAMATAELREMLLALRDGEGDRGEANGCSTECGWVLA